MPGDATESKPMPMLEQARLSLAAADKVPLPNPNDEDVALTRDQYEPAVTLTVLGEPVDYWRLRDGC